MPTITAHGLTFDARPDRIDFRDLFYRPPLISLEREYPPATLIAQYLTKYSDDGMILNQGKEGACTGFGLAAVINYLYWERRQRLNAAEPPAKVSPRMLYHMARLYDEWEGEDYEGSSCRGAMKGWHRHGVCCQDLWPYADSRGRYVQPKDRWNEDAAERPLGAYYRINKDSLLEMQAAIGEVHAIYASATVHEGWLLKRTNELAAIALAGKKKIGGHAFAIVGYRPDGFIIQNSWGPRWGYGGFAVLTYADWLQNGMDAWVAVLGAPVAVAGCPVAISTSPLQDLPKKGADGSVALTGGRVAFVGERSPAVAPWAEDRAYEHSLVLGNDGRPLHRLLAAGTAEQNVQMVAEDLPGQWLAQSQNRKLAIYAHGGLNDETASINRIRVLAPYFKANGIYPLFVTWHTGFADSIAGILEDKAKSLGIDLELMRSRGLFDDVREAIVEAKDRAFEAAAERILAKAVWSQMKQNAEAAASGGGLGLLVDAPAAPAAGQRRSRDPSGRPFGRRDSARPRARAPHQSQHRGPEHDALCSGLHDGLREPALRQGIRQERPRPGSPDPRVAERRAGKGGPRRSLRKVTALSGQPGARGVAQDAAAGAGRSLGSQRGTGRVPPPAAAGHRRLA